MKVKELKEILHNLTHVNPEASIMIELKVKLNENITIEAKKELEMNDFRFFLKDGR